MTIGERLKEERTRLGLSQTQFAELARVKKGTQISWEKDASSPPATALAAFALRGVDALYVLTGNRTIDPIVSDEVSMMQSLDMVEDDLVNLPILTSSDDKSERIIEICKAQIDEVLQKRAEGKVSEKVEERANFLLSAIYKPSVRSELQVAAFAQRQRQENLAREGLELWFKGCAYQPNEHVFAQMIDISIRYSVRYEALIKLVQSVRNDVITVRTA